MVNETVTIGRRGQTVIPASLRKRFSIAEGSLVIFQETAEGILIRTAVALPVETYTPQRKAEFLLSNATDPRDYAKAVKGVRAMGLDPATIPHRKPVSRAEYGTARLKGA